MHLYWHHLVLQHLVICVVLCVGVLHHDICSNVCGDVYLGAGDIDDQDKLILGALPGANKSVQKVTNVEERKGFDLVRVGNFSESTTGLQVDDICTCTAPTII